MKGGGIWGCNGNGDVSEKRGERLRVERMKQRERVGMKEEEC